MARKIPAALAVEGALDSVITNPCSKLLDIDLPVMLRCSTTSVCAFVPGHYLTNVPEYRGKVAGHTGEGRGGSAGTGYYEGSCGTASGLGVFLPIKRNEDVNSQEEFMGDTTCYYPADSLVSEGGDTQGEPMPEPLQEGSLVSARGDKAGLATT